MRKTFAAVVAASCLLVLLPAPATAGNADVHIVDGAPSPSQITINDGDTVTFVNDDEVTHRIFASGQQRGGPIAPHGSAEFGPFETGGEAGTFAYQIDQNGPAGTILVRGPATTSPSSTPTTPAPTTTSTSTTTSTTSTTSTSTTLATTTSVAPTTTTLAPAAAKKDSSNALTVLGFVLLVAGIGGMVIAMARTRRQSRTD